VKKLFIAFTLVILSTRVCAMEIHPENWKPCAIGNLTDDAGKGDWLAIPKWASAPHLIKYYDSPRMLAIHGLCNEKFKRVVLCSPGSWEDADETTADPAARVCKAYFDAQDKRK
jgi:hypothetical protein